MEKFNTFQIQDFLLTITSQGTAMTLEAAQESTEKVFTIDLDSDSIGQITNNLFDNVDKMVQGLKDAASGSFESLALTINFQGKLTYTAMFAVGVIKKEFSFTLCLIEKELEPLEVLSKRLNSVKSELEKWKGRHESKMVSVDTFQAFQARTEQRLEKLENMMMQMQQKMTQTLDFLEKRCGNQKISIPFKPNILFNHNSVNISQFALSDNNQTACFIGSEYYPCLELLPQIPSNEKSSYSIKINRETRTFGFGITTDTTQLNWNVNSKSYRYLTGTGEVISSEGWKNPDGNGPFGGKDKILKMVVDMDQGILTFFVDDKQVNFCYISTSKKYFAYISLGNIGDSVTLMSAGTD